MLACPGRAASRSDSAGHHHPMDIPIILAGALAGGFVLGLTGFGNGLTAYGFWLHVLTPQIGAPLIAIGSITSHLLMFPGFRHAISPARFMPFILGGLVGIPLGTLLLLVISAPAFKLVGGALLASYSIISLCGGLSFKIREKTPIADPLIGLAGGVLGGLASLSGPILTIWCDLKGWSKDEQRGTYQPYNFAMLSAAMVAFGVAGLLTMTVLWYAALSLPATLAGVWLGRRLYGKIDDAQFRKVVLGLLALSGLTLVGSSIVAGLTPGNAS